MIGSALGDDASSNTSVTSRIQEAIGGNNAISLGIINGIIGGLTSGNLLAGIITGVGTAYADAQKKLED